MPQSKIQQDQLVTPLDADTLGGNSVGTGANQIPQRDGGGNLNADFASTAGSATTATSATTASSASTASVATEARKLQSSFPAGSSVETINGGYGMRVQGEKGGGVSLNGGSNGTGIGGRVSLQGGSSASTYGGRITIYGGSALSTGDVGGEIQIKAGTAVNVNGPNTEIRAGNTTSGSRGGYTLIYGGQGPSGGIVRIQGGIKTGGGTKGNVEIGNINTPVGPNEGAVIIRNENYLQLSSYNTPVALPATGLGGAVIFVPNAAGGAAMAFSDGTNWINVVTGATIP